MSWGSYVPNPTWEDAADSDSVDGIGGLKPYDPETTKFEFVRMLLEQKVEILFHTYIVHLSHIK